MRGYTILEMLLVLALLTAATGVVAPFARTFRDRASVLAAREAIVGAIAEARVAAISSGRGSLELEPAPLTVRVLAADSVISRVDLEAEWGVALVPGGGSTIRLSFNSLGLGRMASRTITVRRGAASAQVVVSSFGRVRRR